MAMDAMLNSDPAVAPARASMTASTGELSVAATRPFSSSRFEGTPVCSHPRMSTCASFKRAAACCCLSTTVDTVKQDLGRGHTACHTNIKLRRANRRQPCHCMLWMLV